MNVKKVVFLNILIAVTINSLSPLYAAEAQMPVADANRAKESTNKLKELKKLLTCFKNGCSKKQIAAIGVTIAGLIVLATGGFYSLYRLSRKGVQDISDGITTKDATPLMQAAMQGDLDQVKRLVEQNKNDIYQTDKSGNTLADYDYGINSNLTIYLLLHGVYPKILKDASLKEKIASVGDLIAEQTQTKTEWEARKQEIKQTMNMNDANKLISYIEETYEIPEN